VSKSERTRQFIIEKTAPVFNMYGFEGASLSVLQEATGLTKGSLYGNFRDKEEIAVAAFHYSMDTVRRFFNDRISRKTSAREKILAFITVYADFVFNPPIKGGCPLLNNAVEADDSHTTMRKLVSEDIDRTVAYIASLFDDGRKNGEFKKDIKSRELAFLVFSSIEGALMVSRVSRDDASMKAIVKYFKNLLDQISN
jgi:TetR/AcrR family transcriptional regulator, transcriptional repressor for nem operon